MAAKAILILCAQALFIQSAFSQCTSRAAVDASGIASPFGWPGPLAAPGFSSLPYDGVVGPSWAYPGVGCAGRGLAFDGLYSPGLEFTATSGGALPVTSSSAIAPVGISIVSENVYEGALSVVGELPFVGTTAIEGLLPTAGAGAINHGCGNGLNAMSALSGTSTPASVVTPGPVFGAPGLAYDGLYGPGLAGLPYGANAFGYDRLMAPGLPYDGLYGPGFTGLPCGANAFAYDRLMAPGLPYDGLAYASPIDAIEITPTSGGALPVSSASAIPPTGIALASDNAYEGILAVAGELPFVGTTAIEGVVPSAGAGAVNHACGNGRNAMISENAAFGPRGPISPAAFAPGFGAPGLGFRGDWAGRGYVF